MIGGLFNRDFEMSVGGQKLSIQKINPVTKAITPALRVKFAIEKSDNRDPNCSSLEIYNLSEPNRRVLQAGAELAETSRKAGLFYDWPLVIESGYAGSMGMVFSGDIVHADSHLEGVDWKTTIEAEDGGNRYRYARLPKGGLSFGAGTPVLTVLTALATALGVGLGNSAAHFALGAQRGYLNFDHGVALTGRVVKLLNKYVTSAGYHWSIQDGQLQVLAPDETLMDSITVLSSLTGLVGSPEKGEKGVIKAKSLLQPSIKPGRRVMMLSKAITGSYKATKVSIFGDTWGTDWYTEFEGTPVT